MTLSDPAIDTTPDAFYFSSRSDVPLSSTVTSSFTAITGLTGEASFSITNGTITINSSKTTPLSTISNGDIIQIQHTSAAGYDETTETTLVIGGVTGTFTSVTLSDPEIDTTPDAFSFDTQTDVALSTLVTSNTITVSGITGDAPASITNGEISVDGGSSYSTTVGNVSNGTEISVRHVSSASFDENTETTLVIGGVTGTFTSVTLSDTAVTPETPDTSDTKSSGGSMNFIYLFMMSLLFCFRRKSK